MTSKYEFAFAKKISKTVKDKGYDDLDSEEEKEYVEWEKKRLQSISNQIVEYFPQIMLWHTMIVSMCGRLDMDSGLLKQRKDINSTLD